MTIIHVTPPLLEVGDMEISILRALGRLGPISGEALYELAMPGRPLRTRQRLVKNLQDRNLVWRGIAPGKRIADQPGKKPRPIRGGSVYGLTVEGRSQLGAQRIEPEDGALDRFIARDRRAPVPGGAALAADLTVSSWCASVIHEMRKLPMLVGVYCQARLVALDDAESGLRQVLDAALTFYIDPNQKTYNRSPAAIPWIDGQRRSSQWRVVRLALEIDNGRISPAMVRLSASLYPVIHQQGVYNSLLGGMPRPIILVPPGGRAGEVASLWRDAWADTPAVITTTDIVQHPQHGALWGRYLSIKDSPPQDVNLLAGLVSGVDQWAGLTRAWNPKGA
jgi:hypothetical protein